MKVVPSSFQAPSGSSLSQPKTANFFTENTAQPTNLTKSTQPPLSSSTQPTPLTPPSTSTSISPPLLESPARSSSSPVAMAIFGSKMATAGSSLIILEEGQHQYCIAYCVGSVSHALFWGRVGYARGSVEGGVKGYVTVAGVDVWIEEDVDISY
ncbi:hypothetical protein GQ43DRAFT_229303 [Delitschia confertaspora ATCC 74209]|uniref:Uncharacterized protein n=1 Tax=Delitschia confertaspora ATCC 74209 TaxID=1513339 RepID=A0A9P4JRM1_9PLEO|nr:hypothetical protein GQ43DRAFT_229303 [Delitschia confertaspora ATCC 74209]